MFKVSGPLVFRGFVLPVVSQQVTNQKRTYERVLLVLFVEFLKSKYDEECQAWLVIAGGPAFRFGTAYMFFRRTFSGPRWKVKQIESDTYVDQFRPKKTTEQHPD